MKKERPFEKCHSECNEESLQILKLLNFRKIKIHRFALNDSINLFSNSHIVSSLFSMRFLCST